MANVFFITGGGAEISLAECYSLESPIYLCFLIESTSNF